MSARVRIQKSTSHRQFEFKNQLRTTTVALRNGRCVKRERVILILSDSTPPVDDPPGERCAADRFEVARMTDLISFLGDDFFEILTIFFSFCLYDNHNRI